MARSDLSYLGDFPIAAEAAESERSIFIKRTYLHLAGAVLGFILIEAILLSLPVTREMAPAILSGKGGMLALIAGFMVVNWLAERWARSTTSRATQYLGLSVYVLAEAVFFLPLLAVATSFPGVVPSAAAATLIVFAGLTGWVFLTKQDFSFLHGILSVLGLAALGLIVCSIIFGFSLGTLFTVAMIGFASAYILYDTSNVLHRYRTDQPVAAALALFASLALLFWYIIRLFLDRR